MVFASIREHASSAYIFASTSSDQFCHASSEHFRNFKWRAASTLEISNGEQRALHNFPPAGTLFGAK